MAKESKISEIPEGIMILAVFLFVGAIAAFLIGNVLATSAQSLASFYATANTQNPEIASYGASTFIIVGLLLIVLAILQYFIGRGLLKTQKWARIVLIIVTLLSLALAVKGTIDGNLGMILTIIIDLVIIIYLLFKKSVKTAFK